MKQAAIVVMMVSILGATCPAEQAATAGKRPDQARPGLPTLCSGARVRYEAPGSPSAEKPGRAGQAYRDLLRQVNGTKPLWYQGADLRLPTEEEMEGLEGLWPTVPPDENAAFLYARAMAHLRHLREYPPGSVSSDEAYAGDIAPLEKYVEGQAEAFVLLKEASNIARCEFPPLISSKTGQIDSGPCLANMRQFARLLADAGFVADTQGRVGDAAELYLLNLKMGEHLWQGNVIESLVGEAVTWIGPLERLMANEKLSRDMLQRILSVARECEIAPRDVQRVVERDLLKNHWDMTRDDWEAVKEELEAARERFESVKEQLQSAKQQQLQFLSNAFKLDGMKPPETREQFITLQNRYKNNVSKALSRPFHVLLREDYDVEGRVREGIPSDSWRVVGIAIAVRRFLEISAGHNARFGGLQIRAAIQMYAMDHDVAPDTLERLGPDYLREAPPDPFSGKSFLYKKTDRDWILYSVGENLADDGGAFDRSKPRAASADMVFPARLRTELDVRMRR